MEKPNEIAAWAMSTGIRSTLDRLLDSRARASRNEESEEALLLSCLAQARELERLLRAAASAKAAS